MAHSLDLTGTAGALIADVEPGGPAATAGLRRGDVVTGFAGHPVADSRALARAVADVTTDRTVPAVVIREGRRATVRLRVATTREASGHAG